MKYFVAREQCQGNPLSHFHGNIEKFYVFDSYMYCQQQQQQQQQQQ
jgi:hypothetical protein